MIQFIQNLLHFLISYRYLNTITLSKINLDLFCTIFPEKDSETTDLEDIGKKRGASDTSQHNGHETAVRMASIEGMPGFGTLLTGL